MPIFEFRLPDIGEGVAEGEIVQWNVSVGDVVNEDDPMVEVMTDKATVNIGAPKAGRIQELRFGVGEVAQVGQVIVVIALEASTAEGASAAQNPPTKAEEPRAQESADDEGPAATAVGDIREGLPGSQYFSGAQDALGASGGALASAPSHPVYVQSVPLATPATRRLARNLGIELRCVTPSGPGGRTTKSDVYRYREAFLESTAGESATAETRAVFASGTERTRETDGHVSGSYPAAPSRDAASGQFPHAAGSAREVRKPFVGLRRKIADRMQHSKNTAAHFTFVEECHVDRLVELRQRLRPAAEKEGVRLNYLPFIAKAVCISLKRHPILNARLDETLGELVLPDYVHLGIATATQNGLIVPVIREAQSMSIIELAKEIEQRSERARSGGLRPEELTGSTFTLTSLGKQGGLFATPVLNFPEVGILGIHQLKQRPVVRDGEIVVGQVMLLSLSLDHRIVDGHVGAAFAYDLIKLLEEPERMYLAL
ncbi:MAG: dihydrolipoamide acetyltransferase family protein [Myxococcota bacterium]